MTQAGDQSAPSGFGEQMTGQLRAARVLTGLLERGAREGLPVLEWTISHVGAQVTGRCYAQPGTARRAALAAWAARSASAWARNITTTAGSPPSPAPLSGNAPRTGSRRSRSPATSGRTDPRPGPRVRPVALAMIPAGLPAIRCRGNGRFPYTERTWSGLSPGSGPDRAWQPVAKQIRRVWDRPGLATGNS